MDTSRKGLKEIFRQLERMGYHVERDGGGHWRVSLAGKRVGTFAFSPSDHRTFLNDRSAFRRKTGIDVLKLGAGLLLLCFFSACKALPTEPPPAPTPTPVPRVCVEGTVSQPQPGQCFICHNNRWTGWYCPTPTFPPGCEPFGSWCNCSGTKTPSCPTPTPTPLPCPPPGQYGCFTCDGHTICVDPPPPTRTP